MAGEINGSDKGEDRSFRGGIEAGARSGRIAVSVKDFSFAYGDRPIFEKANLEEADLSGVILTDASLKADRLRAFRSKDPTLDTAADALDLEIVD